MLIMHRNRYCSVTIRLCSITAQYLSHASLGLLSKQLLIKQPFKFNGYRNTICFVLTSPTPGLVKQPIAHADLEVLEKGLLGRLARCDVMPIRLSIIRKLQDCVRSDAVPTTRIDDGSPMSHALSARR